MLWNGVATVGHWPHHQPLWPHHQQINLSRDPIPLQTVNSTLSTLYLYPYELNISSSPIPVAASAIKNILIIKLYN